MIHWSILTEYLFAWVYLCVIIKVKILTSFFEGCVLGLWFILKLNNYGDVYGGCVL